MSREQVAPENYANKDCQQFVQDMLNAGLTPYHYHGRFYWEGPAVDVGSLQDALSETKVKCQWDGMGLGRVVYPKTSSKFSEQPCELLIKDEDVTEEQELREGAVCSNCGDTVSEEEYSCGESNCCEAEVVSEEEYIEADQEAVDDE